MFGQSGFLFDQNHLQLGVSVLNLLSRGHAHDAPAHHAQVEVGRRGRRQTAGQGQGQGEGGGKAKPRTQHGQLSKEEKKIT